MTPARVRASAAAAAAPVALPIPVAGSVQGVVEAVGELGEGVGEGERLAGDDAGEGVGEGASEIVEVVDSLLPELGVDGGTDTLECGTTGGCVGGAPPCASGWEVVDVEGDRVVVVDEDVDVDGGSSGVFGVVVVDASVVVVGLVCGVGPQMSTGQSPGWHAST
jgi:hypothetical protein